jgi:hypothetical protein
VSLDGNGAIIIVVPSAPVNLQKLDTTSATQISLDWDKGHTNGGSSVIDFRVSYDQAADDWIILEDNILTQDYSTSLALDEGAIYKFKL